jgi:type I restriction enzyme S subunit
LKQIAIPLPPLATQRAIAEKLDKLQSLIDLKKQAITKTDELAKSIFLEMFGDPMKNEKGWEVKKLKNFGKVKGGATIKSSEFVEE